MITIRGFEGNSANCEPVPIPHIIIDNSTQLISKMPDTRQELSNDDRTVQLRIDRNSEDCFKIREIVEIDNWFWKENNSDFCGNEFQAWIDRKATLLLSDWHLARGTTRDKFDRKRVEWECFGNEKESEKYSGEETFSVVVTCLLSFLVKVEKV